MRKSNRERLVEAKRKSEKQVVLSGLDDLLKLLVGGELNPTQRAFMYDPARLKAYKGPAGCAKTSTICGAGLARALLQPGSKGLVSRLDYNDLMDTTKRRMEEMLLRLPKGTLVDRDKSPPEKWYIQPIDPDGELSEITFMGLKDSLGSYEFNWAVVDEADEVPDRRVHEINTRLRHKGGDFTVMLAFNPPDKTHWLYTACTGRDFQDRPAKEPAWLTLFEPGAKENLHNLPSDYYDLLAKSLPEDMKRRLVEGEWGGTFPGSPVFRQFKQSWHVKNDLEYLPNVPIFRFWDFGYRRPACVWAQFDYDGRLRILKEFLGENLEVIPFARRVKALTVQNFPHSRNIMDYGDPAVTQKKDTGSTLAQLSKEAITMRYRTSGIEEGLRIIRTELERTIEGEPSIMFDRKGCPLLIQAMRGGYHLDDEGVKAVKDGFYDHLADAFRYGCINIFVSGGSMVNGTGGFGGQQVESLAYDRSADIFGG